MLGESKKKHLEAIWCNVENPASTCGVQELYKAVKKEGITLGDVKEYLSQKRSYTLHKVALKRFDRRRVLAAGPRIILGCDLADVSHLARENENTRYLLVCIDVYSRYLHVTPLKDKRGDTCAKALNHILSKPESKGYRRLWTDCGKEFLNRHVARVLEERNIVLYHTVSHEIKVAHAERVIRTLKGRIYRYLTEHGTETYLPVLDKIVTAYNRHQHRGLNMLTPLEVHRYTSPIQTQQHFHRVHSKWYKDRLRNPRPVSLGVGDAVRITVADKTFRRGFLYQNTEEIFTIARVDTSQPIPGYYLKDLDGEIVKGIFYREELVKTILPSTFAIDIIKRRTRNKRREALVHYRGYSNKHDRWMPLSEITSTAHI